MRTRRPKPPRRALPRTIAVFPRPGRAEQALIRVGALALPCALGRSGVTRVKREGDGATPAGRYGLVALRFRPDRVVGRPAAGRAAPIRRDDGWSDDPESGRYNTPIRLPARESHERLWRDDRLYDMVGVLDWNLRPRIRRLGSAIFLHLCRDDFRPTEGCIALRRNDLKRLLAAVGPDMEFSVLPKPKKLGRR